MPAEIGPNQLATLKCKVDTGAGGNVMPLCAFAKLFPRCINADGSPRGLKSSTTHLTAYNGSKIPQFGTLDTVIDWTPKGQKVANHLQTWWYIVMTHQDQPFLDSHHVPNFTLWNSTVQSTSRRRSWCSRRNSQQNTDQSNRTFKIWNLHPSTQKKISSRHIQIDSKELAISQEHITSPCAVMWNPSYMHHRSAQLLCGHWCEKN